MPAKNIYSVECECGFRCPHSTMFQAEECQANHAGFTPHEGCSGKSDTIRFTAEQVAEAMEQAPNIRFVKV